MIHTRIVAELGGIAEGNLSVMLCQVDAAHTAGCDAVKAQWVSDPARLVERRCAASYAGAYANIAYPLEYLSIMRARAKAHGLGFGVSCYLPEDAERLAGQADYVKVASFEADSDVRLAVGRTGCAMMMSAGMMDEAQLHALLVCRDELRQFCQVVDVLHCVSHYAGWIPYAQRNLGAIRRYGLDGFSDHCRDLTSGADAVLAGARILEVHICLGISNPHNPDYRVAFDPICLGYYVQFVRDAEHKLGDGVKRMQECEREMGQYRARS